ncbi:hypothetical protein J6590_062755 [Homalodisca vitripennis]|nr:hypothetical protein J6590_062755 [Homalodisca vitripennis]
MTQLTNTQVLHGVKVAIVFTTAMLSNFVLQCTLLSIVRVGDVFRCVVGDCARPRTRTTCYGSGDDVSWLCTALLALALLTTSAAAQNATDTVPFNRTGGRPRVCSSSHRAVNNTFSHKISLKDSVPTLVKI